MYPSKVGFLTVQPKHCGLATTLTSRQADLDGCIQVYIGCSHPIQTWEWGHQLNHWPIQTLWPGCLDPRFELVLDSLAGVAPDFELDGCIWSKLGCNHPSQHYWKCLHIQTTWFWFQSQHLITLYNPFRLKKKIRTVADVINQHCILTISKMWEHKRKEPPLPKKKWPKRHQKRSKVVLLAQGNPKYAVCLWSFVRLVGPKPMII
jgi:hypothetical protein